MVLSSPNRILLVFVLAISVCESLRTPFVLYKSKSGSLASPISPRYILRARGREPVGACRCSFDTFLDQGVEFIDTSNPSPVGDMLQIDVMATKLSRTGQTTEWIGAEPRTTRGIYWKRMCEMVHREKVAAIKQADSTEKNVDHDSSGVHQVLNMYTGIAPDDRVSVGSNSLNVIQLAELSLFSFGKVLLPGMDLPLQIHSDNLNGKRMFDQIPAGNGLFGVVTKNETLKRGSISRVGCEAVLQDKWVTDDGRYILETKGRRPFRIVEIVQWNPYPIAIVQILRDPEVMEDSDMDKKIGSLELQSWRSLNDLVWLATEVFDKRSWLPLLMNLDGKQHPLGKMKQNAPGSAEKIDDWHRRVTFSWDMVRVLQKGIPGLWDIDFTGQRLTDLEALKMLQDLNIHERFKTSCVSLEDAREVLRQVLEVRCLTRV
uniref:Lon N-terminal domain-containing protein n=2 Tax=Guillardia theta TaxID=55529 RepID=A0A7S4HB48_GUITH|mmetsp:Transcript_12800/g.44926  ORF Transcript_12800/g.44926 Transcript_12800/m.44926 type:complete len:431 (+) Transcript_12800:67-1359(+)